MGSLLPDASSILSFVILWVLVWVTLTVTMRHARNKEGAWSARIPLFYFDAKNVDVATNDGRFYQGVMLTAFVIVPVILLTALYSSFLSYWAFDRAGNKFAQGINHLFPAGVPTAAAIFSGEFRYGSSNGPSYYPLIQPWLYLALLLAAYSRLGRTLRSVFSR